MSNFTDGDATGAGMDNPTDNRPSKAQLLAGVTKAVEKALAGTKDVSSEDVLAAYKAGVTPGAENANPLTASITSAVRAAMDFGAGDNRTAIMGALRSGLTAGLLEPMTNNTDNRETGWSSLTKKRGGPNQDPGNMPGWGGKGPRML